MRSERVGGKVKQLTLLNLGRHFDVVQTQWPVLCTRIEELLSGQVALVTVPCPATVERHAQRITAQLVADEKGENAVALNDHRQLMEGCSLTHPGVYCPRSSETDWDEEKLWRTDIMLTDLEAVFRSLKSELGLRPVFRHKRAIHAVA